MAATMAAAFSKVCRSLISSNPELQSPTARGTVKVKNRPLRFFFCRILFTDLSNLLLFQYTLPCLRRLVHTDGISYEFKPDRLKQIEASPSGWVPPATGKYLLYSWSITRWNMRSSLRYASSNSFQKSFKFPALGCPFYVKISLLGPQRRCLPNFIPILLRNVARWLPRWQMTPISSFTQSVKVVTRSKLIPDPEAVRRCPNSYPRGFLSLQAIVRCISSPWTLTCMYVITVKPNVCVSLQKSQTCLSSLKEANTTTFQYIRIIEVEELES